jgi:HK97 family phage major capsid protein
MKLITGLFSERDFVWAQNRSFSLPVSRTVDTVLGAALMNPSYLLKGKGEYSILDVLGVTKEFTDNTSRLKVVNSGEAEWVDEETEVNEAVMSFDERVLPKRLSWQQTFTHVVLGQSPVEFGSLLATEVEKAFDRALMKKVCEEVSALSALSGYDDGDAPKAYTLADFAEFEEAARDNSDIASLKWIFSPATGKALRQAPVISGSDKFLFDHNTNTILGHSAYSSKYVADSVMVLGDFSKVLIKMPTQIDFVVDMKTKINQGKVVITATGLYDVYPYNEQAFIVGKNVLGS